MGSIRKSRLIVGMLLALALLLIVNLSASAQPSKPVLVSPKNNENISENQPTFWWENGAGADNHRLVVDNDQNFADGENAIDNVIVGDNFFITPLENALADGVYYWKVMAENAGGENWSENTWTFRVDTQAPNSFTLASPENGIHDNDNTPELSWNASSDLGGIDNYLLYVDGSLDNTITDNTQTSENASELTDGEHYWYVIAVDYAGNQTQSDNTFYITIDTEAPPAPSLISPENNEIINDNTPPLTWENLDPKDNSTPVRYYIAVSDNSEFPHENENSGWISDWILDDNYQVENELADGNWYWRVRAKDNAGNVGDWSDNSFCVDVSMPSLVSPIDGTVTNENTPTFTWENKVVVDNYEIWIDNDSTFSSANLFKDNTTDNIYDNNDENYPTDGWADENWFWKVRAFNQENSHFSEVWTLLIDTEKPTPSADNVTIMDPDTLTVVTGGAISETEFLVEVTCDENGSTVKLWSDIDGLVGSAADSDNDGEVVFISDTLSENTHELSIQEIDRAGNKSDNVYLMTLTVDVTPPTISGITESSPGKTFITIEWTTDEPATSVVWYGETTDYGLTQSDNSLGTGHSITLSGLSENTTYHYRVSSIDAAGNTAPLSSDQQFTTSPFIPPTSSVDTISPYWRSASVTITATASDNDGTVDNVTLWYRYRENSGASWGSWDNFGVDNSSPWSWAFDAPDNDGHYEFYTRATDDDDQTEAAPSTADENAGFDRVLPTISSVQINGENMVTPSTSVVISIVAQDPDNLSGLDQMRFSNDNENWTDWEPYESENDYVLPAGDENKRVYVKVKDNAGNESAVVDNWIVLETGVYMESLGTIAENENKLADFGQFGLLVTGINLFAKDNIDNVEVEVKVVQEKPAEVSEAAPGTATYYFEVETNAPADNLDNVEIRFDVAKSWLDNLGIGAADVKLWKLDNTDNTWQEVSTTNVGENASHVHFSATVPSLSWFAVTGEKPAAPTPYWAVVAGVIIIVVISIVLIWWWKKQSLSSAPSQSVGVAGESQAHPEWTLNRKEP